MDQSDDIRPITSDEGESRADRPVLVLARPNSRTDDSLRESARNILERLRANSEHNHA